MRKRGGLIAMIGSIAVLAAALTAWLAPVSSASPGSVQIKVFKPDGPYEKIVDVGQPGAGPGDQILQWQPLVKPSGGSKVGNVVARVELVKRLRGGEDNLFILDASAKLEGGRITFYGAAGLSQFGTGVTFAVTGGSGSYELARGTVRAVYDKVGGKPGIMLTFNLETG
jgi:hypothetical protein